MPKLSKREWDENLDPDSQDFATLESRVFSYIKNRLAPRE
jgi:hypothetical protein